MWMWGDGEAPMTTDEGNHRRTDGEAHKWGAPQAHKCDMGEGGNTGEADCAKSPIPTDT